MIQPRSSGGPQRPQRRSDIQRRNTPGNDRCTSHATTKNLSYAIRKSPADTAHDPRPWNTARTVTQSEISGVSRNGLSSVTTRHTRHRFSV
ncbi:hypothetical protein Ae406Ps2_6370c [Pseudonocardia sp. Ae406_Ps2]|nr:hypothetical protein Ae406Ps2_6370c [Pseudonocardia sp. Ae406_Ps2]